MIAKMLIAIVAIQANAIHLATITGLAYFVSSMIIKCVQKQSLR